jgi:hypothetical protein
MNCDMANRKSSRSEQQRKAPSVSWGFERRTPELANASGRRLPPEKLLVKLDRIYPQHLNKFFPE